MEYDENGPLISVVTICFNAGLLIEETIKSVISQTYKNIEYIIIDGASTDGTIDIIKRYSDKITYWISEPDKGIFDAMNKGVKCCKGDYIGILNAGDYYEPDACEKLAAYIVNHPEAGVVYGNTNLLITSLMGKYKLNIVPNSTIDDKLLISPMFCHQSTLVKRNLFDRLGFFENVNIAGDWLHFVLLYKNDVKFLHINETIANYLEGGASTTAKGFRESFHYKRKFNTFKNKDYLTLIIFYIKDNLLFRKFLGPVLWQLKILMNSSRYNKIS